MSDISVTVNEIELWKAEHSAVYGDYKKIYGYENANYYARMGAVATKIAAKQRKRRTER